MVQKMYKMQKIGRKLGITVIYTVDFFPHFLFRVETSNVHDMSRKSDISQAPIDDLGIKSDLFLCFLCHN